MIDQSSFQSSMGPTALIDASLVYGASRVLTGRHQDPYWKYKEKYKYDDDFSLFLEFLHALLLYDRIILDDSSTDELGHEIKYLVSSANAREKLIETATIGDTSVPKAVSDGICKLITKLPNPLRLLQVNVPWAYRGDSHYDFRRFSGQIPRELEPVAMFAYRGLCYGAYASRLARQNSGAAVYVAAAGRLAAIEPLLNHQDLATLTFPKKEFLQLVEALEFPSSGFDFSFLSSSFDGHDVSSLAQYVTSMPPESALEFVIRYRTSPEALALRSNWREKLVGRSSYAFVGRSHAQNLANSTVYGDVTFAYILGRPAATEEQIMSDSRVEQSATDVKVKGRLVQDTDAAHAKQIVARAEIDQDLIQRGRRSPEVQSLVAQLGQRIDALEGKADDTLVVQMRQDLEVLKRELEKNTPRTRFFDVTLEGLREGALALKEIGAPVLETVGMLAKFFSGI